MLPRGAAIRPYLRHDRPLLLAHRGGAGLAPENTLVAFEIGRALGADMLELDLRLTRDGELVVLHDSTVDRTTNGSGAIAALTLAEVHRLDAGYRFTAKRDRTFPYRGRGITIPTLREILIRFPGLRLNLDIKTRDQRAMTQVWEIIQRYDLADRVLVGSLYAANIRYFRRLCGQRVTTSASLSEMAHFLAAVRTHTTGRLRITYDALQLPDAHLGVRCVTRAALRAAHRLGIDVHVWTINSSQVMRHYLRLGVDGIITDRPDLLVEQLSELGG